MQNDQDYQQNVLTESHDTRDQLLKYLHLLKRNWIPVVLLIASAMIATYIYLLNAERIYRAETSVKLEKNEPDVLQGSYMDQTQQSFNFIPNQIQILKSYEVRDRVSEVLLDSFSLSPDKSIFHNLLKEPESNEIVPVNFQALRKRLISLVKIDQVENLNVLRISSESPSFKEAIMITNVYAKEYIEYINELKSQDLSTLKVFLEAERQKKLEDLDAIEEDIGDFQRQHGFTNLDTYSQYLTLTLRQYDENIRLAQLDLKSNEEARNALRSQLEDTDSSLIVSLENQMNEQSITEIQRKINELEIQREYDLAQAENEQIRVLIRKGYNEQIAPLRKIRDEQSRLLLSSLNNSLSIGKQDLINQLFNLNLERISFLTRIEEYRKDRVEVKSELDRLPEVGLELSKLIRKKTTNENLYTQLEQKYQETEIRERTRVSDAYILDPGLDNSFPVKPNVTVVAIIGTLSGFALAFIFVFVRFYLDNTIKDPRELENKGVNLIAWIPSIPFTSKNGNRESEFIMTNNSKSNAAESFKALRTKVQYAKLREKPLKTILITSSVPTEGKTFVSVNLAGSFAQAGMKTLLLDCDLRKPKIHNFFNAEKGAGITDFLFSKAAYEEVTRKTQFENLNYISSGTIPPNPSELLGSKQMKDFLEKIRSEYEIIIIDSPPLIAVTDAEILFNVTDGTLIVTKAEFTPIDIFMKAYSNLYSLNEKNLLGVVLNDFNYQKSYGYYYNYYYYYHAPGSKEEKI